MKKVLISLAIILGVVLLSGLSKVLPKQEIWFDYTGQVDITQRRIKQSEGATKLGIPDIRWDRFAGIEEVGWCGEASLQMAAMYNGVYVSQGRINRLGNAKHLDLYSAEIVPAMERIGFKYEGYENVEGQTVDDYIKWIEERIQEGKPVFSGIKLYPNGNPEWNLDHFVLMVGYEDQQMTYNANTPGYGQLTVSFEDLGTGEETYRLYNSFNNYFGYAIEGFKDEERSIIPMLYIVGESSERVTLSIYLENLEVGKTYSLEAIPYDKDFKRVEDEKEVVTTFTAEEEVASFLHENIERQKAYYYQVIKID